MGQRLNIEIVKGGKTQANSYYHWSAYTDSSIELAKKCIEFGENLKTKNPLKFAIEVLESTDAGVTLEEKEKLQKIRGFKTFKFQQCSGRNEGLIAWTEEGMKETRDWQEGCVKIDFDKKMVSFDVISCYTLEDLKEYEEEEPKTYTVLEKMPYDWMSFDEFEDFANSYEDGKWYKVGDIYIRGIY